MLYVKQVNILLFFFSFELYGNKKNLEDFVPLYTSLFFFFFTSIILLAYLRIS